MSIKKDDRAGQKNSETQPEPSPPSEGVFNRPNFAKTVTSLIGNSVKVKTKKGTTYEGVFSSLSSDFDVVVDLSHEVEPGDPFYDRVDKDTMAFKPEDIVSISCVNVNLKEALDMSQRMEHPGDFSAQDGEIWNDDSPNSEPYDKGWNDVLRSHKGGYGNSEHSEGLASFSSIYTHSDYGKGADTTNDSYDGMNQKYDIRGEYPKPQRNSKISPDGSIIENFPGGQATEKASSLNPYAKPFTPMEPAERSQIPLATVVLPTYVVSGTSPSKMDAAPQISGGGGASLLGSGHLQNQCMQYPYDYDEKLYSSYDSLPITAHDYQQYYPHLQYIQYFRRFY